MREPKQEWEYYNPINPHSGYGYDDSPGAFEWSGYKYSDFLTEWPPQPGVF